MAPRRTDSAARLPADLAGPVDLALARSVETIPGESALPGGSRYEPKWDGRVAVVRRGSTARLWTRNRNDISDRFPDIVTAAEKQLPEGVVLDGVICSPWICV